MPIPVWLPLLLGFLSAVGPLSTDMYLPAFPAIEAALGQPRGAAQITLASWFAGLAVGQILQGTLSDRFGRRWPLIIGTGLYTLSTIGCALAPDLVWLAVMRGLSALGGSAGMVITRAIVRDLTEGIASARLMSKLMLVMGAAPILAPSLGGIVLGAFGWQAIFWFCALFGLICFLGVVFLLPETLEEGRRVKLGPGAQLARYLSIITERGFITHALMGGCAMFGMFAFLAGSPPVFIERFGLTPQLYGAMFGVCAASFILASQINPRILPRFGPDRVMLFSSRAFLIATAILCVVAFTGWGGWLAVGLPIAASMCSQGFTMPNATVGALQRHAGHAGSASALMGTMQFSLAAVSGTLAGLLVDGTARPMAVMMFLGALGCVAADLCRPKRR